MRLILSLLLALQALPLNANPHNTNPLLNGFTAEYDVIRNDILLGVSKRLLVAREQGTILDYASTTFPEGLVALFVSDRFMEHSLVRVTANGLQPLSYEYQRSGGKKDTIFQAKFDWQKRQIRMSSQAQPQPLLPDTQDLLSFQLALMQGLYAGQRQFRFQLVDHKRIQQQNLEYTMTTQVSSSLGMLDLLKLEHKASDGKYRFIFWCARQLHYLPVKIQKIEKDGTVIMLKLRYFDKQKFRLDDQARADGEEG